MKTIRSISAVVATSLILIPMVSLAGSQPNPEQDLKAFRQYFEQRFPNTPFKDFSNGPFAKGIGSPGAISQWQSMEEFPPYDFAVAKGKKLFNTPFPNGKTYASCFPHGGIGIAQNYPYVNNKTGQVVTIETAINACREKNGLKPLPWLKGDLADISAYMFSTSDGKAVNVKTPSTPAELKAYETGKKIFYTRRGKLDMSCAGCHTYHSGQRLRAQTISPSLGLVVSFPAYRAKWGALGTIDRRFIGCNKNTQAKPFKPQSTEYRDLQYFLTYMSNGLPINAPQWRP